VPCFSGPYGYLRHGTSGGGGVVLESKPVNEATAIELDAQYRQLREECGLLDRSARGKLLVAGPDAAEFLQGQLTNDVEGLTPGEGRYAALLDRKGHIQSDMRMLRIGPDEIWLDTEPQTLERVRRHLETYKIGRQVEICNLGAERTILSLIGPRSVEVAGTAALPEHASEEARVGGVACLAVGTADGLDLIVGMSDSQPAGLAADSERLREALSDGGAVEIGPEAAEILRIEAGRPRFGIEMSSETMPAEAGIVEEAIDFEKGCYIGQEPVARLHYKGRPNRRLRGLQLSALAEPGAALQLGEKEVGRLGSTCVSPARGPIGLAIVRREAEPGAELTVGEDGVTARVVDLPFG
jgi:tRNA-modifying protein YgfZ